MCVHPIPCYRATGLAFLVVHTPLFKSASSMASYSLCSASLLIRAHRELYTKYGAISDTGYVKASYRKQGALLGGPRPLPQTPCLLLECIFGAASTWWSYVGIRSYKHLQETISTKIKHTLHRMEIVRRGVCSLG